MDYTFLSFIVFAYLFGSVPFGKIISRVTHGLNITKVGSGNIGATNVSRIIGLKWGLLTLLGDSFKGFAPVAAAGFLYNGYFQTGTLAAAAGLAAVVGHQFPVFLGFSGGKGVATALGVFLALCPVCVVPAALVFISVVYLVDYVSVGSMAAALCMPVFVTLSGALPVQILLSFVIAAMIIAAHHGNIARLLAGTENKWSTGDSN